MNDVDAKRSEVRAETARGVWERAARALKFIVAAALILAGGWALVQILGMDAGAREALRRAYALARALSVAAFLMGLGVVVLILPLRSLAAARGRTPWVALELPMWCAAGLTAARLWMPGPDYPLQLVLILAAPAILGAFVATVSLPIALARRLRRREGSMGPLARGYVAVPETVWALLPGLLLAAGGWGARTVQIRSLEEQRARLEAEFEPLRPVDELNERLKAQRRELRLELELIRAAKRVQFEWAASARKQELFRLLPGSLPIDRLTLRPPSGGAVLELPSSAGDPWPELTRRLSQAESVTDFELEGRESGGTTLRLTLGRPGEAHDD